MWNNFSSTESDGGKERYNLPGILECVDHESMMRVHLCLRIPLVSYFEVDTESIHGTLNSLCLTPAEQLSSECQILGMLGPDSPEEEKLNIILNFAKFNPLSANKFPSKFEYGKKRAFSNTT